MKKINYTNFIKAILYIVVASTAINVLLAMLGKNLSHVPNTFVPYNVSSIISANIMGIVGATIVYCLFVSFIKDSKKANKAYLWLSIVVLVLSFIPDINLPKSTDPETLDWTSYSTVWNLMLMHVVTAYFVLKAFVFKNRFLK